MLCDSEVIMLEYEEGRAKGSCRVVKIIDGVWLEVQD